jgi:hypothetical protein
LPFFTIGERERAIPESTKQKWGERPGDRETGRGAKTADGNGSALQSKQHDLERQKITDNLKKGLEHRPEREELVERTSSPFTTPYALNSLKEVRG